MSGADYDVIVVGAGVEGSSSAYHLAKAGQKTLLLEQFPLPHARGSSHGQTRITRYAYPQDYYTNMMLDAFPLWAALAQEADVTLYKRCGVLNVGQHEGQFIRSVSGAMTRHGMTYDLLTPAQLADQYPMLKYADNMGGLLDPEGGILYADRALAAFQKVFRQLGGVVRDGEGVTGVTPGHVVTVTTARGQYTARRLVLATGPWTSKVLKPLGLSLPLKPIRITVCYWREKGEMSHSSDSFPCLIDGGMDDDKAFHIYALPSEEYPGYVKLCLHDGPDIDPDARDECEDGWVRTKVTQYVKEHCPGLRDVPGVVETCIYTNTPDEDPFIDYHPKHSNIVIAAGFSGHGFKLAPAVGKAVSELVMNKASSYDMAPFALGRFNKNTASL